VSSQGTSVLHWTSGTEGSFAAHCIFEVLRRAMRSVGKLRSCMVHR